MLAKVFSAATLGLEAVPVTVEVDIQGQALPSFTIVGLPDKAVEESKERVRAALKNTGAEFPAKRITVNLAPADLPKEGPAYDLPIAVGILIASGQLKANLEKSLFLGELSLDGSLRHTSGVLPTILMAENNFEKTFIPTANAKEAAIVDTVKVYSVENIKELFHFLAGFKKIKPLQRISVDLDRSVDYEFDMKDVKGQETAKRALEIAAAGFHNILLKGPPGAGKTLLSRAFPSILPDLDRDEILEVSRIYSVSGLLGNNSLIVNRPFRSPHHTISRIGLIGGGTKPTPGEISLAHRGVLFLDELPEFPRSVLEALRQPMEDGEVTISRAAGSLTFPSRFLLLAASNPCPCGYLGHPKRSCRCMPGAIIKYRKRLSGPLLDRIDLHVDVPPVKEESLDLTTKAESSTRVRERVSRARVRQLRRFKNSRVKTNGEMSSAQVKSYCQLTSSSQNLLKQAISKLSISARSYFKVIKVAQTIADLNGKDKIEVSDIAEALQYRAKED